MRYDKLVRDKIPEYIKSKGLTPLTHIADQDEYRKKLMEKLTEEMNEFLEDESMEEFIDILEVMDAIEDIKGFKREDISKLKENKAKERGKFFKRIILEEVH
jgi:predicted house-cleaning noncanonical NTP pyrophosphatase (MazG superfamily)